MLLPLSEVWDGREQAWRECLVVGGKTRDGLPHTYTVVYQDGNAARVHVGSVRGTARMARVGLLSWYEARHRAEQSGLEVDPLPLQPPVIIDVDGHFAPEHIECD